MPRFFVYFDHKTNRMKRFRRKPTPTIAATIISRIRRGLGSLLRIDTDTQHAAWLDPDAEQRTKPASYDTIVASLGTNLDTADPKTTGGLTIDPPDDAV